MDGREEEWRWGSHHYYMLSNLIDHASELTVIRMVDNTLTSAATLSRVAATVAR